MKRNPWYVLAQIFATLAGFLVIASSIFFNMSQDNISLAANTLTKLISYPKINETIKQSMIDTAEAGIDSSTLFGTFGAQFLFLTGLLAILSILAWYMGACEDVKEMNPREKIMFYVKMSIFFLIFILGLLLVKFI